MKKRYAFTLMEVLVATTIFSFVTVSMVSVYYAANRNVMQNFRSDKLQSDLSLSMRAIGSVLAQATRIDAPAIDTHGHELVVMTNVEATTLAGGYSPLAPSGSSATTFPCCPMVPTSYGAPAPTWHRFCINTTTKKLYYYSGSVTGCQGCPNLSSYRISAPGASSMSNPCGSSGNNRVLLASYLDTTVPAFSRVKQPAGGLQERIVNATHTRLIHPQHTVNVFLHTLWNKNRADNEMQTPVDYVLEGYFSVLQPR